MTKSKRTTGSQSARQTAATRKQPDRARSSRIALSNDALRRLVLGGRESGEPVDGMAAMKRLRRKYVAMARKQ